MTEKSSFTTRNGELCPACHRPCEGDSDWMTHIDDDAGRACSFHVEGDPEYPVWRRDKSGMVWFIVGFSESSRSNIWRPFRKSSPTPYTEEFAVRTPPPKDDTPKDDVMWHRMPGSVTQ